MCHADIVTHAIIHGGGGVVAVAAPAAVLFLVLLLLLLLLLLLNERCPALSGACLPERHGMAASTRAAESEGTGLLAGGGHQQRLHWQTRHESEDRRLAVPELLTFGLACRHSTAK